MTSQSELEKYYLEWLYVQYKKFHQARLLEHIVHCLNISKAKNVFFAHERTFIRTPVCQKADAIKFPSSWLSNKQTLGRGEKQEQKVIYKRRTCFYQAKKKCSPGSTVRTFDFVHKEEVIGLSANLQKRLREFKMIFSVKIITTVKRAHRYSI